MIAIGFTTIGVYAQNSPTEISNSYKSISDFLTFVVKFLSWGWVIPAVIAWKLMTNDWIFGLGMDKYLWQIWNIMKNFANFVIWFLFLAMILYSFFKWNPGSVIKNYLFKIVVAWVLINLSWFLVLVLLDISLILTVAVSNIPSMYLEKNNALKEEVENIASKQIKKNCKIIIDLSDKNKMIDYPESCKNIDSNSKNILDKILPSPTTLEWPLLYMWYSILWVIDWSKIDYKKLDFSDLVTDIALKAILLIMFFLPIVVLMIVNFVRIFWIWLFIIFMPFVIIDFVFGGKISSKSEAFKKLKFSNFIWLVFMPVAVVGTLSIALLFLMNMQVVISGKNLKVAEQTNTILEKYWLKIDRNKNTSCMSINNDSNVCIDFWDFVSDWFHYVWWFIGWLVMVIFTVVFLWILLQVGFKSSSITANISSSIFNLTKETLKAAPVLPWGLSFWTLETAKQKFSTEIFNQIQSKQAWKLTSKIESLVWVKYWLTPEISTGLQNALKGPSPRVILYDFFKVLKDAKAKDPQRTFSLRWDSQLRGYFEKLLKKISNDPNLIRILWIESVYERDKNGNLQLKSNWYTDRNIWRFIKVFMKNVENIKRGNEMDDSEIIKNINNEQPIDPRNDSIFDIN